MAKPQVEARVTELEHLMAEVLRAQERTQRQIEQTSREMREFKEEMRSFKDESNKRWGELANKLGTMAEDLVAPSVPRILRRLVACREEDMELSAVRMKKHHATERGRSHEFDVVAVCGEHALVGETRSRLRPADITDFLATMQEIRGFFPEFAGKRIYGALATLYPDESLVRSGQKAGLLVLGLGDDLMDVRNEAGFVPRAF